MKKIIVTYAGLFSIVWTLVIFGLCATPGQYIPSASWLELLSFDKWVHAGMFFVLSSLIILTTIRNGKKLPVILCGIAACIAYGGLLEIMQATCFSNRSADWQDFVANSFGCLLALAFSRKLQAIFIKPDRTAIK